MVENLANIASNIYLVSDTRLTADPVIVERVKRIKHLETYEDFKTDKFSGQGALSGITIRKKGTDETKTISVKGAFIAIGFQPNAGLVSQFVNLNEKGEVLINPDCSTSYPGIFAAGDVTNVFGKRIIIACGEGAKAAMAVRQYILNAKRSVGCRPIRGNI
jgi:alkyl hydroperoxide reductase subunit F